MSTTTDPAVALKQLAAGVRSRMALATTQFGAKGDGTTDDTSAINAGLAARTLVIPRDTTCLVGALTLPTSGTVHLELQRGAVLKLKSGVNAPMMIVPTGCTLVITGRGTLDFNEAGQTATSNCHGIYLQDGGAGPTITGITLTGAKNNPIVSQGAAGGTIRGCRITNCGQAVLVNASPSTASTQGWSVTNNTLDYSMRAAATVVETGIKLHGVKSGATPSNWLDGSIVSGNTILMPSKPSAADPTQVIGVEAFGGARGTTITGNSITGGYMGVSVDSSPNTTVSGNTIVGASGYGIELPGTYYNTITGNTVRACAIGIVAQNTAGTYNCVISDNVLSGWTDTAISITDGAHDLTIANNELIGDGSGWAGIHLQSGAGARNILRGNRFTVPSGGGMSNAVMVKSNDTIIDGSTFMGGGSLTGIQDQSGITGLRLTNNHSFGGATVANLSSTPLVKASNTNNGTAV